MIRLKSAIGICILASVLSPTLWAHAATYYVATNGNDGSPGTSSQPWRTVTHAVSKMVAGDTTYVGGGTYNEGEIRFTKSGTQSAPIKLLNQSGQLPVINCTTAKAPYPRIYLLGSGPTPSARAIGWVTIEGFEIRNCYNGIKYENAHDLTVRRNWIHQISGPAILGNGTRILIDRNRINRSSSHGIYANDTAYTVTNNLIYDNAKFGIQLNGSPSSYYSSTKQAGPEYALSANWTIANNTLAYSHTATGIVVWGSTCNNAHIDNNIFYENAVTLGTASTQGISFVSTTCKGISIRNNLAYATGSGGMVFLGPGATQGIQYTQSGNIVNQTPPGFVSAPATVVASPNFALTSTSGAINKGISTTAKIAFNAVSRPQGASYDMGAYEYYTGGSTAQLLLAPTSTSAF